MAYAISVCSPSIKQTWTCAISMSSVTCHNTRIWTNIFLGRAVWLSCRFGLLNLFACYFHFVKLRIWSASDATQLKILKSFIMMDYTSAYETLNFCHFNVPSNLGEWGLMNSGLYLTFSWKKTPWSESARELYWPSDRRLSTKWFPTFANRGCHVVSLTDPFGRILDFLDRSRYFSIK
jgi:hypothetical protein